MSLYIYFNAIKMTKQKQTQVQGSPISKDRQKTEAIVLHYRKQKVKPV